MYYFKIICATPDRWSIHRLPLYQVHSTHCCTSNGFTVHYFVRHDASPLPNPRRGEIRKTFAFWITSILDPSMRSIPLNSRQRWSCFVLHLYVHTFTWNELGQQESAGTICVPITHLIGQFRPRTKTQLSQKKQKPFNQKMWRPWRTSH